MFSHFRLQEFWGNLIPVDVFASDVAKMLPGSNFHKVSEARKCENTGRGGLTVSGVKGFPDNREKCRYPCSYSSVHKIHNRILESIYI